jgi:hypothetical protein
MLLTCFSSMIPLPDQGGFLLFEHPSEPQERLLISLGSEKNEKNAAAL